MLTRGRVLFAALLCALVPALAHADGEAGLVVDYGNGQVDTFCIAFSGDSITGDQLLARAGLDVNQFSGLVCAIGGTGCQHSGTFDSCTCQCRSGSADCTYWGFFTARYGAPFIYSALGFRSQRARDGEIHAWKWGRGSPNSAPAPAPIAFETICGHPPLSRATATPLPATATPVPPTPTPAGPGATATAPATLTATATVVPSPFDASATVVSTAPAGSPAATLVSPGLTVGASVTPAATPAPADDGPGSDGPPVATLAGFGAVVAVLVGAIVAVAWRRRA